MQVMQQRMGLQLPLRFDLIGITSILGDDAGSMLAEAPVTRSMDVRLRVASRHESLPMIELLLQELTALWTGGPAGGGGVRVAKRQRLSNLACLIPREKIPASFQLISSLPHIAL